MLRVVVPTVYCRDPLDEMFGSRCGYFYPPRVVPCRRMNSLMGLSSLAAFVEAMEAMETSRQDEEDNKCDSCSCQKKKSKPSDGSANKEQSCCKTNPEESAKSSANEQTPSSPLINEQPPSNGGQSTEGEKASEAVSVPIEKLDDPDSDLFRVSLNLKSFEPEDIEVKRVDNDLKVLAKQKVERYGMIFNREIRRSYPLPDDVDAESLKSTLSTAGVLTIEAQRRPRDSDDNSQQSGEDQGQTDVKESPNEEPSEESTERPEDGNAEDQDVSQDGDPQMESTEEPGEEEQMDGQTDGQEE